MLNAKATPLVCFIGTISIFCGLNEPIHPIFMNYFLRMLLLVIGSNIAIAGYAQPKMGLLKGNSLAGDIQKVITDLPNHFVNIIGEKINDVANGNNYYSKIVPAGAEECTITSFSSTNKPVFSWKAQMLTTEDFDEAKKKYRELYSQLNNKAILFYNETHRLKAVYIAPTEEKKFAATIFNLAPQGDDANKLKVEITMQYHFMEWQVAVVVYNRDRADNEQGEIYED